MKALIVGRGSIGARHGRILESLGHTVAFCSRREAEGISSDPVAALSMWAPEYVVVANETSRHVATVDQLRGAGFKGPILVEKPLSDGIVDSTIVDRSLFVGYQLRFHPSIRVARDFEPEGIRAVYVYAGQYLPSWRPDTDYRTSYSASRSSGGGVLRDLSHEIDYLRWLFGDVISIQASGRKVSDLEIDVEDVVSLHMEMQRCPHVSVDLNYLDHIGQRSLKLISNRKTMNMDIQLKTDRDLPFREMHSAILGGSSSDVATREDGVALSKVVRAAEISMKEGRRVTL